MRWPERYAPFVILLALTLLAPLASAKKKDKPDDDTSEKPKWSVNEPPGDWRSITIDTAETTWSDVDVSPDGKTLVFDMLGDLYTVPIEGGEAKALTESLAWDFQPRFSPDGEHIAFISDRGGADNLWVMKADGSEPRAVSEESEHLVHTPAWSPDGDYIAAKKGFTSTRSIPAGEIWLFHFGGGGGLQLTERPNGPRDQKTMADPAFSPDGRYVYYSQDTTPGLTWQYNKDSTDQIFVIRRLDRETGEIDTFAGGPGGAVRPEPSPDGKTVAFVKRLPGLQSAIYLKDVASGNERPIYRKLDRDLQETNGSQGNATAFAWTPDSKFLVFWAAGTFHRLDVSTGEVADIPVRVKAVKKIQPALRFPVEVAPDRFRVKMLRWAQRSPTSERAVFQALGHLYVRDLPDGEPRRLTTQNDHFEFYPSLSRDGRWVVYVTWDDQELGSIRMISIDGSASRTVTEAPGIYVEPRFSPDASQVVYRKLSGGYLLSPNDSSEPGVYLVASTGGKPKRLSRSGFNAHFGADPERVYLSDAVEETQLLLKSVNLNGHDAREHLQGARATEFSVSPDGRWVAFTEQYNAYVAPFAATGRKVSIGPDSKAIPVRQVSKRAGEFLHWSADSRSLFWAHGPTLYRRDLRDAFGFLEGAPDELPEPVENGVDLSFEVASDRPDGLIAIIGARVVTMRGARDGRQEVIDDGVVVVRDNRIAAVGARGEVSVPDGAEVIDVGGRTIIPGLVDVHAHGAMARDELTPEQDWIQFSNLSFGVTTIHDPSNDTSEIFAAAELQRAGRWVAPRIYSTGTILYGAHWPGYTAQIDSLDDAKFHVRRLKDVGAISVKSYQQPRREQRQQVLAAARELGMMVVPEGGAKFHHNMNQIVDGHTGIEHAIPLLTAYDDVKQLWSQTAVGYTPTFVVAYGGLAGEVYWYQHTDVWKDELLMKYVPRRIVEPAAMRRTKAPEDHYNHFGVARFAKALRDLGVSVQIGAHGQREGLAAHWEMWMMAQGGFSPWEAIRGATIDGAHYVGLDGDVGSIEVGKLADLVVIDGDPLADIRSSERVTHTMINGRLYETATMNQIAPERVERLPFYFELPGGDTVHPETMRWLEEKRESLGWVH